MEKDNAIQTIIEEVFSRYTDGSYIKASMLPDLDLYVDQITTFLTRHLSKTLFSKEDIFVHEILENVMAQFQMSENLFPNAPKDDQESLREFTFICMLALDIYIKKQVIEAILDKRPETK